MSNTSDDEYAMFDFSEFSAEDLAQIDADLERKTHGGPQITIELEPELHRDSPRPEPGPSTSPSVYLLPDQGASIQSGIHSGKNADDSVEASVSYSSKAASKRRARLTADSAALSPLEEFRYGVLSVTDLTSLAWCEVQVDYGLRQRRSRPLATRPASFVSAQGKEIFVEKAVAEQNDKITKQGRMVHKHLEREIRAEEVQVDITSDEEHLVNMLASLHTIVLEGFTREMPVIGILQDQVVVGIIDEVVRQPQAQLSSLQKRPPSSSPNTPKSKKLRRSISPHQPLISDFLSVSQQDKNSEPSNGDSHLPGDDALFMAELLTDASSPKNILHLIDTKTRRAPTLPSHEDALPSRIQLMLYHRLLSELISTSPPFDFTSLWRRLDLNPAAAFSTAFLVQSGLTSENEQWTSSCLNDLVQSWFQTVEALDISGVDTALKIVYRAQPQGHRRNFKSRRGSGKTNKPQSSLAAQEDLDLARAIEASLRDISRNPTVDTTDTEIHGAGSSKTSEQGRASVIKDAPKTPPTGRETTVHNQNGEGQILLPKVNVH
ncbi:hypothetical protein DXG03_006394 [Asterophora parasitica]|uniref:Uncharacterized protein n=1 Tax=Asterophora parasitica TaxID=117018 RepID=A0A9P7G748_9AGAR|nr:hypothetical protein DXG03_006394 [Asterophora parasitica]